MMSVIGPVQSRYREAVQQVKEKKKKRIGGGEISFSTLQSKDQGVVNVCTVSKLRGVKIPKCSHFFTYFLHIKLIQNVVFGDYSLQPRGYIAECFRLLHIAAKGTIGCQCGFLWTSGRGAWAPNLLKFSPVRNACMYILAALFYSPVDFTDASDLHQTVVKFII